MKKIVLSILCVVLLCSFFSSCSEETQSTGSDSSSALPKEEVELVLEQTAWQLEGESYYLLFTNNKRVTVYDWSELDGENQDVGKFLSYETAQDDQGNQTITISFLQEEKTVFNYNKDTKGFVTADSKKSLKAITVKSFAEDFMQQIATVETQGGNQWQTQAEMNAGSGTICCYWNALYQALDSHLKSILDDDDYTRFQQDNKAFESARETAIQEAGKEVEGGSMYAMVANGAYSTQTKNRIQTILTEYYQ